MPEYRRAKARGATYFFTVNLLNRRAGTLVREVALLRRCVRRARESRPFRIDAMVVLPDHLHAIWTLPPGDNGFSERWRQVKSGFSRGLPARDLENSIMLRPGERGVWQRRFWEHLIADAQDYRRHLEYCWSDPVRHGFVGRAKDWPYSSFHREAARGLVAGDWAGDVGDGLKGGQEGGFGEWPGALVSPLAGRTCIA